MRVLMLHNFYRQPGGEDTCFLAETRMLRNHGDEVHTIEVKNDDTDAMPGIALAINTLWNRHSYRRVAEAIAGFKPDVMHCHNIFPLLSPAVYYAASKAGVPVVQTLHNYRLLCLKASFFREGRVCQACLGQSVPWRGVVRRCYHGSLPHSASVASLLVTHRVLGTWRRNVDMFIAVSDFTRTRYLAAGFEPDRIVVKPNIVEGDPNTGDGAAGFALFAGRLSEEKGLDTVLQAWRAAPGNPRLLIVGDGPLRALEHGCRGDPRIKFLGHCPRERLYQLMGQAAFFIAASEWFETFGMTIIEAFGCGTPVIAARIGAYEELVQDGESGFFFEPGDPASLQRAIDAMQTHGTPARMRRAARDSFENTSSKQRNYDRLIAAYGMARRNREQRRGSRPVIGRVAPLDATNHGGG